MLIHIFFFNDTATTEIYTLSLHDALPIWGDDGDPGVDHVGRVPGAAHPDLDDGDVDRRLGEGRVGHADHDLEEAHRVDRKSTRLNSSHANISYAVFCLKKKIQHEKKYKQK